MHSGETGSAPDFACLLRSFATRSVLLDVGFWLLFSLSISVPNFHPLQEALDRVHPACFMQGKGSPRTPKSVSILYENERVGVRSL